MIYTLLCFTEIDPLILGQLTKMSLFSWSFMFLTSIIFRYCYIHRLPLYYIAVNEFLVNLDYYVVKELSWNKSDLDKYLNEK